MHTQQSMGPSQSLFNHDLRSTTLLICNSLMMHTFRMIWTRRHGGGGGRHDKCVVTKRRTPRNTKQHHHHQHQKARNGNIEKKGEKKKKFNVRRLGPVTALLRLPVAVLLRPPLVSIIAGNLL